MREPPKETEVVASSPAQHVEAEPPATAPGTFATGGTVPPVGSLAMFGEKLGSATASERAFGTVNMNGSPPPGVLHIGDGSGSGTTTSTAPAKTGTATANAGTAGATTANAGTAPAGTAPVATAPASTDPAARHATWKQVSDAKSDDKGKTDLDIKWIDELPDHLRNSIDVDFADDKAEAAVGKATKPGLAKIDAEENKAEAQLKKDTAQHLKEAHHSAKPADIAADPDYQKAHAEIEKERAQRKADFIAQQSAAHDAAMDAGKRDQSVAEPGAAKIERLEGVALARTNFMSWAVDVLGSAEAVKTHFKGIKQVKGHPGMWLAASARTRFEAAEADFEANHPGYTFPDTSVAHAMRGMHQARWGIGMLGHALGEAFDFLAIDNPNIKIDDNGHNYGYLVGKFGGHDQKRGTGRATMSGVSEPTIEKLGKDTVAGTSTPEGQAMMQHVQDQFAEMSATSERIKAAMASQMPKLQATRDLYFGEAEQRATLAKAQTDLKQADRVASGVIAKEKITDPEAKKARTVEIKQQLADDVTTAKAALEQSQKDVLAALQEVFAGWIASIQGDIDTDTGLLASDQAARDTMTHDEQALDAIDAAAPDAQAQLDAFATAHGLTPFAHQKHVRDAKAFKVALARELKAKDAKAGGALKQKDSDANADITVLKFYQAKLTDPAFVFGKGVKGDDGHWASKYDASQVPLMQLLEHGTVRDDKMPARETAGKRQQVYNGDVIGTLAKFGWAPGAAFGDTMHFDFIEGYNAAVPGGRSQENMKRSRYSPEGDLPPAPAKVQAPAKTHK